MNFAHLDTNWLDELAKFVRIMKKAGADFTGPMQSTTQRSRLVSYLAKGCPEINKIGHLDLPQLWKSHELSRLILGDDYISPSEASEVFGFTYTNDQRDWFEASQPGLEVLLRLKANDYMLLAGPSTTMDFFDLVQSAREDIDPGELPIGGDRVTAGKWIALHKGIYPNSCNKTLAEQKKLLSVNEFIPNYCEVIYAHLLQWKTHDRRPFNGGYVRTSSVNTAGKHRIIGDPNGLGKLHVGETADDQQNAYIGLASAFRL